MVAGIYNMLISADKCSAEFSKTNERNNAMNNKITGPTAFLVIPSGDTKADDKKILDMIERTITNPLIEYELDCEFLSDTKASAEKLYDVLLNTLEYKVDSPSKESDGWHVHSVKQVNFIDLQMVLNTSRDEATKNSSELYNWIYYVTPLPSKSV